MSNSKIKTGSSQFSLTTKLALTAPEEEDKPCKTVSGQRPGTSCNFPFIYNENTYDVCTLDGDSYLWCATKVDLNGEYIADEEGFCYSDCPSRTIPG